MVIKIIFGRVCYIHTMEVTRSFLCKNFRCRVDGCFRVWEDAVEIDEYTSSNEERKRLLRLKGYRCYESQCASCGENGELRLRQMRCSNINCEKCINDQRWIASILPSQCNQCEEDGQPIPLGKEQGVFTCKFLCDCKTQYNVRCKMTNTAECYGCGKKDVHPFSFCSRRIRKKTDNVHSCSECNGQGNCPNFSFIINIV